MRSSRSSYQSRHIEREKILLQQSYEKAMGRIPSNRNYDDSHTSYGYSSFRPKKPYSVIPTVLEKTNTQVSSPYKNSSSSKQYQFKLDSPRKDAGHQNNYFYTTSRYISNTSTNYDSPRKQPYFQGYETRRDFLKTIINQNTSPEKRNSEYSPSKLTYLALQIESQNNENKVKSSLQSNQISPSRRDISDFRSSPISAKYPNNYQASPSSTKYQSNYQTSPSSTKYQSNYRTSPSSTKYQSTYQTSPSSTKYQSNYQTSPSSVAKRFETSPRNDFPTSSKHATHFTSTSQDRQPSSSIRFTTTSESKVPTKITSETSQSQSSKNKVPKRETNYISTSSKNKPTTTVTESSQNKTPTASSQSTAPSKSKLPNPSAQSAISSKNSNLPTTTPTQLPEPSKNNISASLAQSTAESKNKFSQQTSSTQNKSPVSTQLTESSKNKLLTTESPKQLTETPQNKTPPSSTASKKDLSTSPEQLVEPPQKQIQQSPTQSETSKNKLQSPSSAQNKLPAAPTQVIQTTPKHTETFPSSSEAEKLPKTETTPESKLNEKNNNSQSLNQNNDQVTEPLKSQKEFLDQVENSMKEDSKEDTNEILAERLKQYNKIIDSKDDSEYQSSPNKSFPSETNNSFESPSSFKSIDNNDNDNDRDFNLEIEISFDENDSDLVNTDYEEDEFIRPSPITKKTVKVDSYQFPKMLDLICTEDFFIKPKVKFMIESTIELADKMTSDVLKNILDLE